MQETELTLPLFIDSTMLTTFKSCQRKFYYSFLQNLHPPGRSVHLVAGGAFAAGLEEARRYAWEHPNVSIDALLEAALPRFISEWGDFEAPPDSPKSFHATFCALEYYLHTHHPQQDNIQPFTNAENKPLIEFSFAIPMPIKHPSGEPFIFVGRFDMLGRWNDLPCIVDEKTTSALGPTWPKQFDLRGQFLGYAWACKQLGYNVNHVFVRGISLKKYDYEVMTVPKQYPNWLIDRWFEHTCLTLESLCAHFKHGLFTYNFGDACASYGGCGFTSLCEAKDPSQWYDTYDTRTWSPVKDE